MDFKLEVKPEIITFHKSLTHQVFFVSVSSYMHHRQQQWHSQEVPLDCSNHFNHMKKKSQKACKTNKTS